MINAILDFSLKNRFLVIMGSLLLLAAGVFSAMHLPVDAVPDITNTQVQIVTRAPALIAGTLYVPSFRPNAAACQGGGDSWLYSFDYKDGSAPSNANGTENNTTSGRVESQGSGILADPSVDLVNEDLVLQSSNAGLVSRGFNAGLKRLVVRSWRQKWN